MNNKNKKLFIAKKTKKKHFCKKIVLFIPLLRLTEILIKHMRIDPVCLFPIQDNF